MIDRVCELKITMSKKGQLTLPFCDNLIVYVESLNCVILLFYLKNKLLPYLERNELYQETLKNNLAINLACFRVRFIIIISNIDTKKLKIDKTKKSELNIQLLICSGVVRFPLKFQGLQK